MRSLNHRGFTLVELVAVIVILALLAVVAVPRMLNLSTAARSTSLEGVASAMDSVITQVQSKAYIQGLTWVEDAPTEESEKAEYIIDFGFGEVEVDWGTLCPESAGEEGDKLSMADFLKLSLTDDMSYKYGNRYFVVGYNYPFELEDLDKEDYVTLPEGCYVIYDSFGRPHASKKCPPAGCECTVRVMDNLC